jgi:hypothetical protein
VDEQGAAAEVARLAGHASRGRLVVEEIDGHVGAVPRERDGDGPADALLRARH